MTIPQIIKGDTVAEGPESFTVELTSATGASLGREDRDREHPGETH